jgi:hypothetical protein
MGPRHLLVDPSRYIAGLRRQWGQLSDDLPACDANLAEAGLALAVSNGGIERINASGCGMRKDDGGL